MKRVLLSLWSIEAHVRGFIAASRWLYRRVPVVGRVLAMIIDRALLLLYGVDVTSATVDVRRLSISHPSGVLLGGNGIKSVGRVAIMSGVKFVGRSPSDPEYVRRQRERCVFILGDNVVIGANSVVVGPLEICDDVIVGTMSLVNRSIAEPGIYVGVPVKKISDSVSDEWVEHL